MRLYPPSLELGVNIRVCQTIRTRFTFGIGYYLPEHIAKVSALEQAAEDTPGCLPPNRVLQRSGDFRFNRDGHVNMIVHLILLEFRHIAGLSRAGMSHPALAVVRLPRIGRGYLVE
jgi:hypothetical protein